MDDKDALKIIDDIFNDEDNTIIREIINEREKVPFGNSDYQIANFAANDFKDSEFATARSQRDALLSIHQKLRALFEAKFRREESKIEIQKIEAIMGTWWFKLMVKLLPAIFLYKKLYFQNKINELIYSLGNTEKVIRDAAYEIAQWYKIFKTFPVIADRVEFNKQDPKFYQMTAFSKAKDEILAIGQVSLGTVEMMRKANLPVAKIVPALYYNGNIGEIDILPAFVQKFPELEEFRSDMVTQGLLPQPEYCNNAKVGNQSNLKIEV